MYKEIGAPPGITDIVMVTDAKCRIPNPIRERFLEWKKFAQARVASLVLGNQSGELSSISDEVHHVSTLDPSCDAVGRVLSL